MILTGLPQRRYSTSTCYLAHYLEDLVWKYIYSYKLPKHLVLFLGKKKHTTGEWVSLNLRPFYGSRFPKV